MAKYLDYAGLQYLWAKIKNYVSTQPLGSNVRYDQQTITDPQKAQARENINATPYNYNLLDNGWFLVNSREQSSYATAGYTVDRWKNMNSSATTTVTSDGLTLTSDTTGGLRQNISAELNTFLTGKSVTFSILFQDGTISEWKFAWSNSHSNRGVNGSVTLYAGGTNGLSINRNATISVRAFKLEIGSFSTLKYDTLPEYGEELSRCIYSTADPTDTYANNGFGRSNENLLDNPFFTVNQRGVTSGQTANATYFIDRWLTTYGSAQGTYSVENDGIKITPASGTTATVYHRFANVTPFNGKTLTASILLNDGTIYSGTITRTNGTTQNFYNANGIRIRFTAINELHIDISQTGGYTIRAVKLELGSVSTLANDSPPDYEQALNDCQYRCVVYESMPANFLFCRGVATTSTNLRAVIDLPRSMAKDKVPTVTMTGSLTTPQGNTITEMASASTVVRGNKLVVNCTTSGLTGGNTYDISTGSGGQTITISADL